MLRITAISLGFYAALTVCGCTNKANTDPVSELPQRNGTLLESTSSKFNDVKPSLSADGLRAIFISGRESTDAGTLLKAFKVDWPEGGAPAAPVRLTTSDIGFERSAQLSPDGLWVALTAEKDGKTSLYLQDFASAQAPVMIVEGIAEEPPPAFSPDSKLLAWVTRDASGKIGCDGVAAALIDGTVGTSAVCGVTVGTGTAADVGAKVALSASTEYIATFFWIPTGVAASYQVALGTQSDFTSGSLTLNTIKFTALADAAGAARTAWLPELFLAPDVVPKAAAAAVVIGRKAPTKDANGAPTTPKTVVALGGGASPRALNVVTEPIFAAPGAAPTELAGPPGHELLTLGGISADGAFGFGIFRQAFRAGCDPAVATLRFATTIAIFKADGSVTTGIVPRTTATPDAFEVAKDVCDMTRADGSKGRPDDEVMDLAVNANATDQKARALYVTRFTQHFDETCVLKAGDPEIFGLDISGGTPTIQPVSVNRAPIVDNPLLPNYGPCVL